jgi:hypothetical protein
MSYKGTVKNGVVVLPPGARLEEGAQVEIIPNELKPEDDSFLAAVVRVARPRPHWPRDYARNLDHYLYGAPKAS